MKNKKITGYEGANLDSKNYVSIGIDEEGREIYSKGKKLYTKFITKDSGKRKEFSSGMKRDINDDKPMYILIWQPMLKRWAELMTRGAKKYGINNWMLASGEEELNRFKDSALRHMYQWLEGDESEDHAAAVFFNISGAEYVKSKLNEKN